MLKACPIGTEKEDGMTVRITRKQGARSRATLRVEGRLVGEWAVLLEAECLDLQGAGLAVCLDLAGVGFVDRAGIETLGRLARRGAVIRCPAGAVASVLEAEGVRVTQDAVDR